jgi:hypothetical protein
VWKRVPFAAFQTVIFRSRSDSNSPKFSRSERGALVGLWQGPSLMAGESRQRGCMESWRAWMTPLKGVGEDTGDSIG